MNEKRIDDFNCKFAGKAVRLTRRKGIYSLSREREKSGFITETGEIVIILNAYCDSNSTYFWVLVVHKDVLINLRCWNEDFGAVLV